jgi:3-methyladenine DNA glycosylase AlkC
LEYNLKLKVLGSYYLGLPLNPRYPLSGVHSVAEPFKNLLNQQLVEYMADHFDRHYSHFDQNAFIVTATRGLESLELKARSEHITQAMTKHFPADFEEAGNILLASLGPEQTDNQSLDDGQEVGISGWAMTILANYVALKGQGHFDLSMMLLKEMTKRFSSEFAIRFFILQSQEKTLALFELWVKDPDQHVRRLVSEGSRPRLPWAMQLPQFIEDPTPVIALLEHLKDDDEEYVRRSVANNLNDIAKDHPELVADIAERWLLEGNNVVNRNRQRLVRHACRTLIKNGHKKTLAILGYLPPVIKSSKVSVLTPKVIFGEALEFSLSLESNSKVTQPLMIDYIVHHQKANSKTTGKVFKWSNTNLLPGKTLTIQKKHAIKKITTRVYHAGLHGLEVVVNGVSIGRVDFDLIVA